MGEKLIDPLLDPRLAGPRDPDESLDDDDDEKDEPTEAERDKKIPGE